MFSVNLAALLLFAVSPVAPRCDVIQDDYASIRQQAEQAYQQKSYSRAHDLYERAAQLELDEGDERWVDFRLADTLWRAEASGGAPDQAVLDQAMRDLTALVRDINRNEDQDRVWVEVYESIGDYWWDRDGGRNWNQAWNNYNVALEWWAGQTDLELARERYLHIIRTVTEPTWWNYYEYRHYTYVPVSILENALKIAQSPEDQAHAAYHLARTHARQYGGWRQQQRLQEAYQQALELGRDTEWYDDALFGYAEWMGSRGPVTRNEDGQWTQQPDYVEAVRLYQRIIDEFRRAETRYYDDAQNRIKQITDPVLALGVGNFFLPESRIQYYVNWRNLGQIDLALYEMDLTEDVTLRQSREGVNAWLNQVDLNRLERIRAWQKDTEDTGKHIPGNSVEQMETLPVGAYVLEARGEGRKSAREFILVTDAAVVLKATGDKVVAYCADALTGAPIAEASLRLWVLHRDNRQWIPHDQQVHADENGLYVFDPDEIAGRDHGNYQYLLTGGLVGGRQAMAISSGNDYGSPDGQWSVYAFADRPAYRPGETVNWKIISRVRKEMGYTTPAGQKMTYEIYDPRGTKVTEGDVTLNNFGAAWSELELDQDWTLGEYRIVTKVGNEHKGNNPLFRLEEYKLPEFQVTVSVPEVDGHKKRYQLGEYVQAEIQADYYFGGPVGGANVEVVVYRKPHWHWWTPKREFPWFYEDQNPRHNWWPGWQGDEVHRETTSTDETGKAYVTFETPEDLSQEYEYSIQARVTDASRREIIGQGTVRVTRQTYYANLHPKHNLHEPNAPVEIDVHLQDANGNPVSEEGRIVVHRLVWNELWLDPLGNRIEGEALAAMRERHAIFPPPPVGGDSRPWRRIRWGYEEVEIATTTVRTDEEGEATYTFRPKDEGYYRVTWQSPDVDGLPVEAQTNVWVATGASRRIGYHQDGVEILVDKDTVAAGRTLPVMISTPVGGRYVLFTIEGNHLYSHQLVHVPGNVKLIEVPIDRRHVPNVRLSAVMLSEAQMFQDFEDIIVPPVQHFLNVELTSDREQYQPGETGMVEMTVTDHEGKPVVGEVALALVDESVLYIQSDYAGDPRKHYFNEKQRYSVSLGSTFQQRQFVKLVERNGQLMTPDQAQQWEEDERRLNEAGQAGGAGYDTWAQKNAPARARGGALFSGGEGQVAGRALADAAAAPTSAPMEMAELRAESEALNRMDADDVQQGGPDVEVQMRTDFRSTIVWEPKIVTNDQGKATIEARYADSLTAWQGTARVATAGDAFGIATITTRTRKPLIARLQAPRFFVAGDRVVLSGVYNNNTDQPMTVQPQLTLDGEALIITGIVQDGRVVKGEIGPIEIPANSEARMDWEALVQNAGEVKISLVGRSQKYADGMEKTYPVFAHGIEKFLAKSGKVRGDEIAITLDLPAARGADTTTMTVQVSPSLAVTMLDALPYLIDYPYGCVEQTMSRFLPAAVVAKTLRDLDVDPEIAMTRAFGGIVEEFADETHPRGKRGMDELDDAIQQGLDRLYDFQHSDGGWGWWKDGPTDRYMTAYVLWGMTLAAEAGIDVKRDVMGRAANYLNNELIEEEDRFDRQSWMLHALAGYHALANVRRPSEAQQKAFDNLWNRRERLNSTTRALLAITSHTFGDGERTRILIENLENGVKRDEAPDTSVVVRGQQQHQDAVMATAHWGEGVYAWRWSDSSVEATSFVLMALAKIQPDHELIEPAMNWLVKNRRGNQWRSTKETAIAILGLNQYLRQSGELGANLSYEVVVNGTVVARQSVTPEQALGAPSTFEIDSSLIQSGANEVRIRRTDGDGAIYFSAQAQFFSLEEPVTPAGNEIFVRRQYFKIVPQETLLKGVKYERIPLADEDYVRSGERIEVVLTIESKNNYEYLVFEDLKPAGLEAVEVQSGQNMYARQLRTDTIERIFGDDDPDARQGVVTDDARHYTGNSSWVYQEYRDRKVAMFISSLPQGVWEMRYELRAEVPGRFHALPTLGHAMYVPEIRCNSAEVRLNVEDR